MTTAAFRAAGSGSHKPELSLVDDPASLAAAPAPEPSAPVKRAYPAPAEVLTQEGPRGLRFDFNDGCRVHLPEGEHPWRVRLLDLDTGNILFETDIKAGRVNSSKRYY